MLTGKNIVSLKKGTIKEEYDRVYLTHGPLDKLEDFTKTEGDGDLQYNGDKWTGKRLATVKVDKKQVVVPSNESVQDLVQAALNHCVTVYPFTEEQAENPTPEQSAAYDKKQSEYPWRLALELWDAGLDMSIRGDLQSKLVPMQPLNAAEAEAKLIKTLMAAGLTQAQAIKQAKIALTPVPEEEAVST